MISKKYVQELLSETAFKRDYNKTIDDLFLYVIESEILGNYSQVKELLKKMSMEQFLYFCEWFKEQQKATDGIKTPLSYFVNWRFEK